MKGSYKLTVQAAHMKYELELSRNITILRGDSATGKTVLVEMIQEYNLNGSDTGIQLSCEKPCRVIAGNTWKEQLVHIEESIVFIDEGNRFVSSEDFARTIRGSRRIGKDSRKFNCREELPLFYLLTRTNVCKHVFDVV